MTTCRFTLPISDRVRLLAEAMDLPTALAQVCCPLWDGKTTDPRFGALHLPTQGDAPSPRTAMAELSRTVASWEGIPPLLTADLENGPGAGVPGGTCFPLFRAAGVVPPEHAYAMGRAAAIEGRAMGFHWTFAPCVDLAADPDSPMTGSRVAGSDPAVVEATALAYMRGVQDHGMAATAKHFPGEGHDRHDQHLTTVVNPLSMPAWWQGPGRIYRTLIDAGLMAIMPGHISLPAYDQPDPLLGLHPPATLSRRLLTDLLRGELGFDGIIVSDAVNMAGILGFAQMAEASARFIAAGGDCILFCDQDPVFLAQLLAEVERGTVSEAEVRRAARRMLAFKERLGLLDRPLVPPCEPEPGLLARNQDASRRLVAASMTLARDRFALLPLDRTKIRRVLHLVASNAYAEEKAVFHSLTAALRERFAEVEERVDSNSWATRQGIVAGAWDLVVASVGCAVSWGTDINRIHGPTARNLMGGWMRMGTPTVFVSHHHPTIHEDFPAVMDTVVLTYGWTPETNPHLVRALLGEVPLRRL